MLKKPYIFILFCFVSYLSFGQTLTSSNLPIVVIDTKGLSILDEPKIMADMKIIYNGAGKRNNLTDIPQFQSKIGIENRGSTSQTFPKKPYGFELWDDKGVAYEAPILGFPKDEDWILFASYNEKSLLHNAVAMKLYRDMGLYASRTQHVEVMLNGQYIGVYVLMEKIKHGAGRVAISQTTPNDNSGDALTGGYIFKIDKNTGSTSIGSATGWVSKVPPTVSAKGQKTNYFYHYPNASSITLAQKNYLQTYVDSAEAVLLSGNAADKINGFRKYFDSQSFAKFFIINEVSRNVDGYRISTFFHKERHSIDRRIKAGPPWDFDLGFANADYCNGWLTTGWAYLFGDACPDDFFQVPFQWRKMLTDFTFQAEVGNEYARLRKDVWKTTKINAFIDSVANTLQEAQARNFQRWPVLGQYLWPNPKPVPTSWQAEVNELKTWLDNRMWWLDSNMPQPVNLGQITGIEQFPDDKTARISVELIENPTPENVGLRIDSQQLMEIDVEIFDINGKLQSRSPIVLLQQGKNTVSAPIAGAAGTYMVKINTPFGAVRKKVLKK